MDGEPGGNQRFTRTISIHYGLLARNDQAVTLQILLAIPGGNLAVNGMGRIANKRNYGLAGTLETRSAKNQ
jgi:hypothetical protein